MSSIMLSPDVMIAASVERTGLDDFGENDFREGLDLLLAEIGALELAPECIAASAGQIGMFLDARAIAVRGLKLHAEALPRSIDQPLIIAGLVRSGTTALHQLMSLDPQFQGPAHWLTLNPMPRPSRDKWDEVPQYRAIAERMAAYVAAAPEMADDHMMSAEGIEESIFILASSFASNMWPSMWDIPRYDAWYRVRDDTDSYRWLADLLRLIGLGDGRRWLLKNPTDLFSMREVLAVFPEAMIVQTHRDPVEALPSISSLILAARRVFMGERADPKRVGRREQQFWAIALERAEVARAAAPSAQFFDVEFSEFRSDQLGIIRSIYDHFGLILSTRTEQDMRAWLAAHPARKPTAPRHVAEDYGLSREGLRQCFADYRRKRGYAGG